MERETCKVCGSPLIEIIPGELYRCSVDLLYHRIRKQTSPTPLKTFPKAEITGETSELSQEQLIFASRMADTLTSSRTNPNWKAPKSVRNKVQREFTEVLLGKRNLAEWFTKTRQDFNLRSFELAQILYDSLEGLKSADAQKLREEWLQFIQKERTGYGL